MTLQVTYEGAGSIGASDETIVTDTAYTIPITLASDSWLTGVQSAWHTGNVRLQGAVYEDNAGAPGELVAFSGATDLSWNLDSNDRWVVVPMMVWLPAGDYHLGVLSGVAGAELRKTTGGLPGDGHTIDGGAVNGMPDGDLSTAAITATTDTYSIRGVFVTEDVSGVEATIDHGLVLGHQMEATVEGPVEVAIDHGLVLGHQMSVDMAVAADITHRLILGHSMGVSVTAAGTSSVVITHNLGVTPSPGEIIVTPRNVDHDVIRWAVSGESPTTFTVTVDPAPGSGNTFDFGWLYVPATVPLPPEVATNGLVLWLEADDLVLSDGDPVGTWSDRSGLSNNAVQVVGANQPIYKAGIVNSLPVVRFGGISAEQWFDLPNIFSGAVEGEIFIVLAVDNDPPAVADDGGLWRMGTALNRTVYPFTDGVVHDDFGTSTLKNTGDPSADLTAFHLYNVSATSGSWISRINGVGHFSVASNTVGFASTPSLGRSGASTYLDGDIAAVIAYERVLSGAERFDVETYLTDRFSL